MAKKYIVFIVLIFVLTACNGKRQITSEVDNSAQVNPETKSDENNLKEADKQASEAEEKLKKLEEAKKKEQDRVKRHHEYELYLRSMASYYSHSSVAKGETSKIKYKIADLTNDGLDDLVVFFDGGIMVNMYSKLLTYDKERDDIVQLIGTSIGTEYYESGVHFSWPNHQQDPNNPQSGSVFTLTDKGTYEEEFSNYEEFLVKYKKQIEGRVAVKYENANEFGKLETEIPKDYIITEDNPVVEEISGATLENSADYPKLTRLLSMFAKIDKYSSKYDLTPRLIAKMTSAEQYLKYDIPAEMVEFQVYLMDKKDIVDMVKKVFATDISLRPDFKSWKGNKETTVAIPDDKAAVGISFDAGAPSKMSVVSKLSKLKDGTYYIEGIEYSYSNYDYSNNSIDMFEPKMSDLEAMGLKQLGKVHGHLKLIDGYYVINWVQSY